MTINSVPYLRPVEQYEESLGELDVPHRPWWPLAFGLSLVLWALIGIGLYVVIG